MSFLKAPPITGNRTDRREAGMTLVEVIVALTLASGGVVGTVSTIVKCTTLRTATRMATEDRQLTRAVFAQLRGSSWQTNFTAMHATALLPTGSNSTTLSGGSVQTVTFPASDLTTLLGAAPATGARFLDVNGDGVIDLATTSTQAGLFPVRVAITHGARTVKYFSLVRTP
jgi:type II secretory pathway pseudopilin PulG